jgi:DNA excision repair protein ERCC-2
LKKEIHIAVRELVHHALLSGDLIMEFLGSIRSHDAIRAHQKIQKSRPDTYQAEVSVSHRIETDLLALTISGRIDGVFKQPDRIIIEEIKTTTRNLDFYERNQNQLHWGQAKTYAYLYSVCHNLKEVDVQLTYYHIESGKLSELKKHFDISDLESFFKELLARYLQWAETVANWCDVREASIHHLQFPFKSYRPGQREMAVEIYRKIKTDGQLLIQAATGIGKTIAAIFPAIKAIGEGFSQKIFYLTARTTGRTVAEKALDELRAGGLKIKSITLTAKDKICFNPLSACHPDECEFARGHYDRLNEALASIFKQDAFTRTCIEQTAEQFQVCPFEFSLDLALWADVIICDYNYAFDPRVFLRRFFQEENGAYTFLVDEAHNLVDRSREMFSAEIFKQSVLDVRRAVKDKLPHIFKCLGKINSWLVKARKSCEEVGGSHAQAEPPEDLYPHLRRFLLLSEKWLAQNIKTSFREPLLEFFFTVSGFLRVSEQYDPSYATCYRKIGKDLKLRLFCIDPSGHLENAFKRCRSTIFFSATMTPMKYFKTILGCDEHADQMILPSPFPPENLGLFISSRISTLYRHRNRTKPEVARTILTLVRQAKGNYLLFFPSYEYMMMVYESFQAENPEIEAVLQTPSMPEAERDAFLMRFEKKNPKTLVGFAVMGGIFGEGIDLVGKRLSGAAIVGVGLPALSLENDIIRDYFASQRNVGFEYAYLYPGINRVLQAAGRVIRTDRDRGVVLLIDQRYGTMRYTSLLPDNWRPIRIQNERQLADDLKRFWNQ